MFAPLFYTGTDGYSGIGGAMDLVSNPDKTKVIVTMQHVSKDGTPKLVKECSLRG